MLFLDSVVASATESMDPPSFDPATPSAT